MKKGSTTDVLLIVVIGFGMILAGLFAMKVMTSINDAFQAAPNMPTEAKESFDTVNTRLPKWIDGAFLLFYVLMMVLGLFLAMQINTNPVFIPVSIFYFIFLIFISRLFSVIYSKITESALSAQAGSLTVIPYIMPRLPVFSFIFGAIIIGLMVVKR